MLVIKGSWYVGLIDLMPPVVKEDQKTYQLVSSLSPLSVSFCSVVSVCWFVVV